MINSSYKETLNRILIMLLGCIGVLAVLDWYEYNLAFALDRAEMMTVFVFIIYFVVLKWAEKRR